MTQQERQFKKVKLYRVLKVVFYCLGLPLFVTAVFLASVRFIGSDPFQGNTDIAQQLGFFTDINKLFTAPALYGVWIALAIWVGIAIVHIILAKTVKSRRVRALSMTALTMVVMLSCLFGMDAALSTKIEKIAETAPASVTVQDYKTLLSYYRTITSSGHGKNLTESLIKQVELLQDVYHVELQGANKTGVAGSIANKPVTYYNIISDEGVVGIDISFKMENGFAKLDYTCENGEYKFNGNDGIDRNIEGNQVIRLKNVGDVLKINGQTYSHYCYRTRVTTTGETLYTWYTKDMESTSWREDDSSAQMNLENGVYGPALYSQNGLLSDGWIFSLDNVLEILEDYYEAKEAIDNGDAANYANYYKTMYNEAVKRRDDYYNGRLRDANGNIIEVDPWLTALYNQEVYFSERFSLTRGELDELLAKVGALLGDNKLFDYLFGSLDDFMNDSGLGDLVGGSLGFLGGSFSAFFKQLNEGLPLSSFGLDKNTLGTVNTVLSLLTQKTFDYVDDIILTLSYKASDCFGIERDHLYLALVRGVGEWKYVEDGRLVPLNRTGENSWVYTADESEFTTTVKDGKTYDRDGKEVEFVVSAGSPDNIYLDVDFDDELLDDEEGLYAFDLDTLSAFLSDGINNVLDNYKIDLNEGTLGTIFGLVKGLLASIDVDGETYLGLEISGIKIPILDSNNRVDLDIIGILHSLLQNWYNYQSAVIKPVWEFYVDERISDHTDARYIAQQNYAKYERALYTATTYGGMIGSTLIGDTLGTGAYPSSLGLTSLAAVQQLKVNLSYQPQCFPLFALRDMIVLFAGVVVMFYFLSFIAAQREEDYATGKLTVRSRKNKETNKHETEVIAEFDANGADNKAVGEDKPAEEKPAEEKPAEVKTEENTPEETKPEEAGEQPADTKPEDADVKPEDNGAEKQDGETAPVEDVKPEDTDSANADEPVQQEEVKGDAPDVPVDEKSDEEVL